LAEYSVVGYQGKRRRILVVDDNNASMLVSLLQPLGFSIGTACNGLEALDQVSSHHTDLVLLDLVMPGMDGLETAKKLRTLSVCSETRIIGASATVSGSSHKIAFSSVCDDFVAKPIRIDLLLEKIRQQLELVWETTPGVPSPALSKIREESPDALMVPPRAELQELYQLALLGDMRKIQAWAARLAEDDAYRSFARKLSEMAGSFRTKAVLALVERYLAQDEMA
jgi:CheY-like chemotaxis protein